MVAETVEYDFVVDHAEAGRQEIRQWDAPWQLDEPVAVPAAKVVVMGFGRRLVSCGAFSREPDFIDGARGHQCVQSSVDSRNTQSGMVAESAAVNLRRRHGVCGLPDYLDDRLSRGAAAVPEYPYA